MFRSRLEKTFANQFETSDNAFVYRKRGKGAAYPVTQEEYESFCRRFRWSMRGATALLVVMMVSLMALLVFWGTRNGRNPSESVFQILLWTSVVMAIIPYVLWYRSAFAAPQRALEGRRASAPALSSEEFRKAKLTRVSYWQLAVVALVPLLWLFPGHGRPGIDPLHGWGRLWWMALLGFAALAGVQAYRKHRYSQD